MGKQRVFVVGVGMTKFHKPGKSGKDYPELAVEAATKALKDAGISYEEIEQAVCGYVYGSSTCGQRAVYELGMTGIPVYNVNNACATGSSALYLAKQLVERGGTDCVLALGFEKMQKGSLTAEFTDRANPAEKHVTVMAETHGLAAAPITPQMFGNAGREHMKKYGTKAEHFAKIAHKNHKHSVHNPLSQFQKEYSLQEIMTSPMVHDPLTKLQCCPTSDGAAAAIVCNENFLKTHPSLKRRSVEILGIEMGTDFQTTFNEKSCIKMVGYDMAKATSRKLYEKTGIQPNDVQVIELHDCFSTNELITYEALGLCDEGKGGELVDNGDNTYGGKYVINPSGGLISKGHPLGATGLAQCTELCSQLRGECGKRQVPNANIALQHNLGIGGAVVVALYKMAFSQENTRKDVPNKLVAFKSDVVFKEIEKKLAEDGANIVKQVNGIVEVKITDGPNGNTKIWTIDIKNGKGSVKKGTNDETDCILIVKDEDFVEIMAGKMAPDIAFFKGKLKVSGNIGIAMKLKVFQQKPLHSKL